MRTNSLKNRELEFIELYPYHSNSELAVYFNKSLSTIKGFANSLELKKDRYYISSLRSTLTKQQHHGKNFKSEVSLA